MTESKSMPPAAAPDGTLEKETKKTMPTTNKNRSSLPDEPADRDGEGGKLHNYKRTPQAINHPKIQERLAAVGKLYKPLYIRVMQAEASPHEAIRAQCLECVMWIRDEITHCTDIACPLYPYRPYQEGDESA